MGSRLDKLVYTYGITRIEGEGDFELRQRAFPIVFIDDQQLGTELLLGNRCEDWHLHEKVLAILISIREPTHESLSQYAFGMHTDPVDVRTAESAAL
jgi:hypothetical protein